MSDKEPEFPKSAGSGEEDSSEEDETTQRFRRLVKGEDEQPAEESSDADVSPSRHPTGIPQLTGGWYASGLENEESEAGPPDPDEINTESMFLASAEQGDSERYPTPPPRGDSSDLPERVPESDVGATRVNPVAYDLPPGGGTPPAGMPREDNGAGRFSGSGGCLLRMGILGLFLVLGLFFLALTFGIYEYYAVASSLPSVDDLRTRTAQFETTRILDREGNLLYEILDPQAGRRTYVPLDEISPYVVAATIATEDSQFYTNPGYDPTAIVRAFWQNYQEGEVVSGASTITQQLARNLLLDPEERSQVSGMRKIREILLASEITRRYTKDEILELYLNQIYFGNLAYGIEAASQTYFDATAAELDLTQASFLTGLVQAPSVYDVYTNREETLARQDEVLFLIAKTSVEQGCIFVSNADQPICVTPEEAGAASAQITNYEFNPPDIQIRYPHWVNFIRTELESLYDPQTIYRSGFTVHTTLNPSLQRQAQEIVQAQIETLVDRNVSTGAAVVLQPSTGEILAMIGSADYDNEEIDGQVNMAIRPRQPGSSFKPLTYTAAFEKGWTPATLIWDVPSEFPPSGNPDDPREPYKPVNYDERFHGPVTVRTALANSYNVPAVKTLDFVGIYDDPTTQEKEGLVSFAERMGITTLTRDDFGLALTLGGGDVTLLELTGAFANYANDGLRIPLYAISRIEDLTGEVVYEYEPPEPERVISAEHAFLINSILSDNDARAASFGQNSALRVPFQAAAKTGTTNDFRDNWTLGYTPDVAVGVWVGNADFTPMQNTSGLTGAGPIWNQLIQIAQREVNPAQATPFSRPAGIFEEVVCAVSGAIPSEWCPSHKVEFFAPDQPPLPQEKDLWQKAWLDTYSLLLASADCSSFVEEKLGMNVKDPWGRDWIKDSNEGKDWAERMGFGSDEVVFIPDEICTVESPRPLLSINTPLEGQVITSSPIEISGVAAATDGFRDWFIEFGAGTDTTNFPDILNGDSPIPEAAVLMEWDVVNLPNGPVVLLLTVRNENGGKATIRRLFTLALPTPTPEPTALPAPTDVPTNTPAPTPTPTASPTP